MNKDNKEHHAREDIIFFDPQTINLDDFQAEGPILDIGGGGEGVIGQLKGQQVIAIDASKRELEEAPPGAIKLIMDARQLKFLDNTFATATAFFSLMYIQTEDHHQVFAEIFRVLIPRGRLLLWEFDMPIFMDEAKRIGAFRLSIKMPDGKIINTGYGTPWREKRRDIKYYMELAKQSGFEICESTQNGSLLYLEVNKPLDSI